eukprot:4045920-Prymnesium_polylepis.1
MDGSGRRTPSRSRGGCRTGWMQATAWWSYASSQQTGQGATGARPGEETALARFVRAGDDTVHDGPTDA